MAWHGFRDHNYDIFLRRRSGSGDWARRAPPHHRALHRPPRRAGALTKTTCGCSTKTRSFKGYRTGATVEPARDRRARHAARARSAGGIPAIAALRARRRRPPRPSIRRAGCGSPTSSRACRAPAGRSGSPATTASAGSRRSALTKLKGMDRRPALADRRHDRAGGLPDDDFPITWAHEQSRADRQREKRHSAATPSICARPRPPRLRHEARAARRARRAIRGRRGCASRTARTPPRRPSTTRAASCACCSATSTRTRRFPSATAAATRAWTRTTRCGAISTAWISPA